MVFLHITTPVVGSVVCRSLSDPVIWVATEQRFFLAHGHSQRCSRGLLPLRRTCPSSRHPPAPPCCGPGLPAGRVLPAPPPAFAAPNKGHALRPPARRRRPELGQAAVVVDVRPETVSHTIARDPGLNLSPRSRHHTPAFPLPDLRPVLGVTDFSPVGTVLDTSTPPRPPSLPAPGQCSLPDAQGTISTCPTASNATSCESSSKLCGLGDRDMTRNAMSLLGAAK